MSKFASDASKNRIITKSDRQFFHLNQGIDLDRIIRVHRRILAAKGWFRIDAEADEVARAVLELADALSQSYLEPGDASSKSDEEHVPTVLTTSEAADILMVSRPYVVKLLEQGEIDFHRVGTHRRIRASDLYNYKNRNDTKQRKAMDDLVASAQELDMGYD
jgi:excisionase family DNA binding protein